MVVTVFVPSLKVTASTPFPVEPGMAVTLSVMVRPATASAPSVAQVKVTTGAAGSKSGWTWTATERAAVLLP